MKCLDIGVLQAYIDGELDIEMKKGIETHLITCTKCSQTYQKLKANDDFSFKKINDFKQYFNEKATPALKPLGTYTSKTSKKKGVSFNMLKYKKYISAACIVLVVTTCISVQPIRAAISNALSIFRVENVEGINISLKDIEDIKRALQKGGSNINIDKFGKFDTVGGLQKPITLEAAKEITDFTVQFPSVLSGTKPTITNTESSRIDLNLNVDNVNEIIKTFEGEKLFPQEANGKTFSAKFSRILCSTYKVGKNNYTVTQTKSPELVAPEGVDVDELYNSLIELPMIPDNLKVKLRSIKNWKSTLYIPVIDSMTEEIQLNGTKAFIYSRVDPSDSAINSWIMWYKNSCIFGIQSNTGRDDIIQVAQSMR